MRVAVEKKYTINAGNYESYTIAIRMELDSEEIEGGDEMEPETLAALCIQAIDNVANPQIKASKSKIANRDSFIHRL